MSIDTLQIVEGLIIGGVIVLQGVLTYKTYNRIGMLKALFQFEGDPRVITGDVPITILKQGSSVESVQSYFNSTDKGKNNADEFVEIAIISASSSNAIDNEVINNINSYLIKNNGAIADYHLLKDVVDREVDSLDGEINSELSAPLYLGLAATMSGIIFGLLGIPALDDQNVLQALDPLLNGVKMAMVASVIGLILTTYLSIVAYKKAKAVSEKKKNRFLSFLQANLLPELVRTETSGITALNDRLKRFGRTLAPAISSLSEVVDRSLAAVRIQQEIIGKIEELDANKLSKANVVIFNKIREMMDSFNQFATYYQELNRSMLHTVELTSGLKELVVRTKNFESIAKGVEETFQQNKELNQFLATHLIGFKSREVALQNMADSAERNLKGTFDQMLTAVQAKISAVQNLAIDMEPEIKEVFTSTIESLKRMTGEQVVKIEEAFEGARPQFEKLDRLDKIEFGISSIASQGLTNIEKQDLLLQSVKELIAVVSNRQTEHREVAAIQDNSDLLAELKSINRTLRDQTTAVGAKYSRRKTALLAVTTVAILSLVGVTIYALLNGLIIFW
jgi:hypothetical protein